MSKHEYLQREFNDHPSLASIDDYEPSLRNSPAFDIPSHHSGFRSPNSTVDSEQSDTDSNGPWSPPAWRRPASGWFQAGDRLAAIKGSPSRSREMSPDYDDPDTTLPVNVPLPRSPEKQRTPSPSPPTKEEEDEDQASGGHQVDANAKPQTSHNYIRFALRAEVQQRTEPIEAALSLIRRQYRRMTSSKTSLFSFLTTSILIISIIRGLFQAHISGPGPDLVKVAGLARSFEPLIHYSQNGVAQIGDLQETGVAVWDLGESVRYSNMTSAPIIVKELDNLSESLKTLAIELTRFFANVDGDIDSILIVMEWAKRELSAVSSQMPGKVHSVYENVYDYAHKVGGDAMCQFLSSVFGDPQSHVTKSTLQRTFNEFLNVLEESINTELHYSTALFGLFEAIDRQFLNLQRTVIRETDSQDAEKERKDSELADLWRRAMGANKSRIHKFEKNKALLESIKGKTVQNKLTLVDHNGKLLKLKSNLEILRKRLVSPLLRNNESSTLSIAEQIQGLDGTHEYLRLAREKQKSKLMERLYGSGGRRGGLTIGDDMAIGGSTV